MRNYNEETKEKIIELYVNQKRGQAYVCKQVHTSPQKLKRFLRENGYHIRTYGETANKSRETHKNKEYFSSENSNMAWLMGFIASDGSIRKDVNEIKIGLSSTDREILEKIKHELELQTNVKGYVANSGFPSSKLQWTCEQHKKDLASYGICYDKTFNIQPPFKLNRKYWIDFIRGYFDGDGSVNYLQSNKALRWQVCSATKAILQWIIDFLYEEYQIPKVNILERHNGKHPLYYFQYSTNSTKKIHDILYTNNSLFLQRKKQHFDEIIKMI